MSGEPGLLGAAKLRELLAEGGVVPQRSMGQNFVVDPNTIRKVVRLARIEPGDRVLEVGAGAGSLTLGLAAAGAQVVAIEKDDRLMPVLERALPKGANVEIVRGDALDMDLDSFAATSLVANLPYNIAATVVLKALDEAPTIRFLTVMTQREVGERLAAPPRSKVYGQTSVLVAGHGNAHVETRVSRRAFFPVPNVDSVVVRVERHERHLAGDVELFRSIVRAAFAQRRKTIRNALTAAWADQGRVAGALSDAGIDPGARAEDLPVDDYVRLTEALRASERPGA